MFGTLRCILIVVSRDRSFFTEIKNFHYLDVNVLAVHISHDSPDKTRLHNGPIVLQLII